MLNQLCDEKVLGLVVEHERMKCFGYEREYCEEWDDELHEMGHLVLLMRRKVVSWSLFNTTKLTLTLWGKVLFYI